MTVVPPLLSVRAGLHASVTRSTFDNISSSSFRSTALYIQTTLIGPTDTRDIFVLLDTGSATNLVDSELASHLHLPSTEGQATTILTIDNSRLPTLRKQSNINLAIGKRLFTSQAYHLSLKAPLIILGKPWLDSVHAILDFEKQIVSFPAAGSAAPAITSIASDYPGDASHIDTATSAPLAPSVSNHAPATSASVNALSADLDSRPSPSPVLRTDNLGRQDSSPVTSSLDPDIQFPSEYEEFKDVFYPSTSDVLPSHTVHDHSILLIDNQQPPFGPMYSLSEAEQVELRHYVNTNLANGLIQPSKSPAGAPILFVKKKDNSLRLCVDYRGLNSITVKDRYPLPIINDLLDSLGKAVIFTKLDLKNAYHLIRIKEGDEWKTAFRTRFGHFEYKVMPFGLCNAPATFQRMIQSLLAPYLDNFVVVYLDDILIFSADVGSHKNHVQKVLQVLQHNHLYVSLKKCEFGVRQTTFLGFLVGNQSVRVDDTKIGTVQHWPTPTTLRQVQSFVGFCNFYRRFIHKFSELARPLTLLSRKSQPFHWLADQQASFDLLKEKLTSAPILRSYDSTARTILETDASGYAIAAIISQLHEQKLHPIAFHSRQLTSAESHYDTHDRELLAIIDALKVFRHYLQGHDPFQIITDHQNLTYFTKSKKLNRRQANWSSKLADFHFEIIYKPGTTNKADALSRREDFRGDTLTEPDSALLPLSLFKPVHALILADPSIRDNWLVRIKEGYDTDPLTSEILRYSDNPDAFEDSPNLEELQKFIVQDGLILRDRRVTLADDLDLKKEILQENHDSVLSGHPGSKKTLESVKRGYYWFRMQKEIAQYTSTCEVCNRSKPSRSKPKGLLKPLPVPARPWSSISMDFITNLPSSQGHETILVVVDRLTKMASFIPCVGTKPNGLYTARLVFDNIFRHHGLPSDIVSDRDSVFTSGFWQALAELLHINTNLSTAYHPQTDGQTERVNAVLEQYLRAYVNFSQDDWIIFLTSAEFSYNNSWHSSIKTTPFYANYGFHPSMDSKRINDLVSPCAEDLIKELHHVQEDCKENMRLASQRHQMFADRFRAPTPHYETGQRVWLNARNVRTIRPTKKLDNKKIGPFEIIQKVGTHAYKLQLPPSIKIHPVFHVSLLELYRPPTFIENDDPAIPLPVVTEGVETDKVAELIADTAGPINDRRYRIRWLGLSLEHDSWVPGTDLIMRPGTRKMLQDYHLAHPELGEPTFEVQRQDVVGLQGG